MNDHKNDNPQMMISNNQQGNPNSNLEDQNLVAVQPVVSTGVEVNPNPVSNINLNQNLNGSYNYPQGNSNLNQQNPGGVQANVSYPQVQQVVNTMEVNPNPVSNTYPQQSLNPTTNAAQPIPTNNISNQNLVYNQNLNSTPVINNQPIVNNVPTQMINNQQVAGNGNNEELLKAFIGNNYDKITTKNFNFAGFFLTSLYLFYRKMFLYGILVFIINFILMNFIHPALAIIVNVLMGLFVNKLYIKFASKKINKIKVNNGQADINSLLQICSKKGGVSIGKAVLGTFVCLIISIVVIIVMFFVGITTVITNFFSNPNEVTETENNNNNNNSNTNNNTYNGVLSYDTSINIKNEFSISVPNKFKDTSDSYEYSFEYDGTEGVFSTCSVSLSVVNSYSDANKLIEQMANYYSSDVNTVKLNGTNWKNFSLSNSFGTTYYYGTTKDKKVYLLEYKINEDADSDCASYREEILSSIKAK